MDKSYYFQHDYNASNDVKLLTIRGKYGWEGIGWYWMMLEAMAQNGGYIMATLLGGLSLGYSLPMATLIDFIKLCVAIGLFKEGADGYYSPRLLEHFAIRAELKASGKRGAEARWAAEKNGHPNGRKGKERKGKKRKESIYSEAFEKFWHEYPNKKAKLNAWKFFQKVDVPLSTLLEALEKQKASAAWQKDGGQFIPHPATWLNQKRWEDELTTPAPEQFIPTTKAKPLYD